MGEEVGQFRCSEGEWWLGDPVAVRFSPSPGMVGVLQVGPHMAGTAHNWWIGVRP